MDKQVLKIFLRLKKEELTKFGKGAGLIFLFISSVIGGMIGISFLLGLLAKMINFSVEQDGECLESFFCQTISNGMVVFLILFLVGLGILGIYNFVLWIRVNIQRAKLEAAQTKKK